MPFTNSERHSDSDAVTIPPDEQPLTPREARFVANYTANGRNGAQAWITATTDLGFNAPSPQAAAVSASKALKRANVAKALDRHTASIAVRDDWTIQRWRGEVAADWQAARDAGSWSAVASMQTTMGRHIGALTDARSLNADEAKMFAWLGAAMQAHGVSPAGQIAQGNSHEIIDSTARALDESAGQQADE